MVKNACLYFLNVVYLISFRRKFSSAGRASALQAEGHRFEPCNFHQTKVVRIICGNSSVVERHLAKVNVAGSNLVSRSNIRTVFIYLFC